MTTLENRPNSALLVVDVQNCAIGEAHDRDAVVARIATLVADAHTTEDATSYGAPAPELVITHTNLYWADHTAPGREGGTVMSAEIDFAV